MTDERKRLAELCERLMHRRRDEVPCSHNLLAQLRDDARDGALTDDDARVYLERFDERDAQAHRSDR